MGGNEDKQAIIDELADWLQFPSNFYKTFDIEEQVSTQWNFINLLLDQRRREFTIRYLNELVPPLMSIKNVNYYVPELLAYLRTKKFVELLDRKGEPLPEDAGAPADSRSQARLAKASTKKGKKKKRVVIPVSAQVILTERFYEAIKGYVHRFLTYAFGQSPTDEQMSASLDIMRAIYHFHRNKYVPKWNIFLHELALVAYSDNPPEFESELRGKAGLEYWLIIHLLWQHRFVSELHQTTPELSLQKVHHGMVRHVDDTELLHCLEYLAEHGNVVEIQGKGRKSAKYLISDSYETVFVEYMMELPGIRNKFKREILEMIGDDGAGA